MEKPSGGVLAVGDIPEKVVDEISKYYKVVNWDNYQNLDLDQVQSRKLHTQEKIAESVEMRVIDPDTFEEKTTVGDVIRCFVVRGIWNDDHCDIYQVSDMYAPLTAAQ